MSDISASVMINGVEVKGVKSSFEQIEKEPGEISKNKLEEILMLTGESKIYSNMKYIGETCKSLYIFKHINKYFTDFIKIIKYIDYVI